MIKTTSHRLSPMIRQDLTNLANELPYTGQDHNFNLMWHFEQNDWDGINTYIDVVYGFVNQAHRVSYNKPIVATFYEKLSSCMVLLSNFITEAKKWLNR